MNSRGLMLVAGLASVALVLAATPAGAAWLAGAAGSTSSTGLAMPAGSIPSPSIAAGSADVTLSWAAETLDAATLGYRIQRFPAAGGAGVTPGPGCAGTLVVASCTESSVPPGQWRYALTPVLANWLGAQSARSASVAVPPRAPTALSATPVAPDMIGLTWTPVTGATSYTVYRSTSVAGPFTTSVGTSTSPSFSDTPPVAGTAYSYAVTATAGGLGSAMSNVATATAPTPPGGHSGPVVNPGFESGALAPWVSAPAAGGSAAAVTSFSASGPTYQPVTGSYFAVVTPGAANTYSHLSQTIQIAAGDSVTGSAFFFSGDYMPYNDDGAVVIEHNGVDVATVFASNVNATGQNVGTPWTTWSYTFPSAGTYTIDARVRNSTDGSNPSWIGLDNISYTSLNGAMFGGAVRRAGTGAAPQASALVPPPATRYFTRPPAGGTIVATRPKRPVPAPAAVATPPTGPVPAPAVPAPAAIAASDGAPTIPPASGTP